MWGCHCKVSVPRPQWPFSRLSVSGCSTDLTHGKQTLRKTQWWCLPTLKKKISLQFKTMLGEMRGQTAETDAKIMLA